MTAGAEWVLKNHSQEVEQLMKEAASSGAPMNECLYYVSSRIRNLLVRDLQAIDRRVSGNAKARNALYMAKWAMYDELEHPAIVFEDYVWDNIRTYGYDLRNTEGELPWHWVEYDWNKQAYQDAVAEDSYEYQLEAVKDLLRRDPDFVKDSRFETVAKSRAQYASTHYIEDVYLPILQGIDPDLAEILDYGMVEEGVSGFVNPRILDYVMSVERDYMNSVKPNRTLGAANRTKTSGTASRGTTHSAIKASRTPKSGSKSIKSKTASKSVKSKAAGTGRRSR